MGGDRINGPPRDAISMIVETLLRRCGPAVHMLVDPGATAS
jgi:hypothetical protein